MKETSAENRDCELLLLGGGFRSCDIETPLSRQQTNASGSRIAAVLSSHNAGRATEDDDIAGRRLFLQSGDELVKPSLQTNFCMLSTMGVAPLLETKV